MKLQLITSFLWSVLVFYVAMPSVSAQEFEPMIPFPELEIGCGETSVPGEAAGGAINLAVPVDRPDQLPAAPHLLRRRMSHSTALPPGFINTRNQNGVTASPLNSNPVRVQVANAGVANVAPEQVAAGEEVLRYLSDLPAPNGEPQALQVAPATPSLSTALPDWYVLQQTAQVSVPTGQRTTAVDSQVPAPRPTTGVSNASRFGGQSSSRRALQYLNRARGRGRCGG